MDFLFDCEISSLLVILAPNGRNRTGKRRSLAERYNMFPVKRFIYIAAILALSTLIIGCSDIEPKTGTRVLIELPSNPPISRQRIGELSIYLKMRSEGVLNVAKPRIDAVKGNTLVLLLPGKKVEKSDVEKILQGTSLEFYHLKNVATKNNPDRPWKLSLPQKNYDPYVFTGPDSKKLDSVANPKEIFREVAGHPAEKPIMTGGDVLRNADLKQIGSGWAAVVQFTEKGSEKFDDFCSNNRGEYLAVFYNGYIISAALVDGPIEGKQVCLTGFRTLDQARIAVCKLNTGTIPEKVSIKSVEYY